MGRYTGTDRPSDSRPQLYADNNVQEIYRRSVCSLTEQGVALTGRHTTGPLSRAAPGIGVASYGARAPSTYNNLFFQCILTCTKSDSDYNNNNIIIRFVKRQNVIRLPWRCQQLPPVKTQ